MAKASPTPATKSVSLAYEIHELQRVLEGVVALVEVEAEGNPEAERVTATLGLVACRLRDLGRVLRGSMPVNLFWTPQNAALEGAAEGGGVDVILGAPAADARHPRRR
jgi:hypothetical protein